MTQITFAIVIFSTRFSDFSIEEMFYYDAGKLPLIIVSIANGIASFAVLIYFRRQSMSDGIIISQQKFQTGHIIAWALTESLTLSGFLTAMTRNSNSFVPFFFAGIALMIIHFPKELFAQNQTTPQ